MTERPCEGKRLTATVVGVQCVDHADHGIDVSGVSGAVDRPGQARLIFFRGALEQAILELIDRVEDDVEPPAETHYTMDGAQVRLPETASERQGIQPVVHLKANEEERADISPGDTVNFSARIEMPPQAGKVVQVEWDFEGAGEFAPGHLDDVADGTVNVQATHSFNDPGTYFPVLRVTPHRDGNVDASHARTRNIGRVRVVVE